MEASATGRKRTVFGFAAPPLFLLVGQLLFVFIAATLFGEGSTELAVKSGAPLLIGTVRLDAKNFRVHQGKVTLNGNHTSDIELTFKDLDTGQILTAKSKGKEGLFYLVAEVGHRYQLARTHYMDPQLARWPDSDVYAERALSSVVIDTIKDGINILGHVNWQSDGIAQKAIITLDPDYEGVKKIFEAAYPNSNSNAVAWTAVGSNAEGSPANPAAAVEEQSGKPRVRLEDVSLDDIYPVFRTYYDAHPLGKAMLHNLTGQAITDMKVSFQVKEFMTDPVDCHAPSELNPGETKEVDLFGLFLPSILETTQDTKAQASIDLKYTLNGQPRHQSIVRSIPILRRSATTWTDDRRAAAFVTNSDPAVLFFSKNVYSMVKGKTRGDINPNVLTAIALFEALQLFGLTYSQDPIPTLTSTNQVVDYIQFPRQTLEYKGGKCSDFSVLFSALLESIGIETAFVTIPGHIFIAFCIGENPDEVRKTFSKPDDLIIQEERSWIPVEVTERAGFLQAWRDGAKEWRENLSKRQASFYLVHDAWKLYGPVGLSGAEVMLNLPASEAVVARYGAELNKFVDQEVSSQAAALERAIQSTSDPRKPSNSLGVLFARYGQYDRARHEFEKLLAKEDYVPALVNVGNILYLQDQKRKALDYYDRAYKVDPRNPAVLLAIARVNHDLENYAQASKSYAELKGRDPDLAQRFAYLDLKGEESTRAADASGISGVVIWDQ